VPGAGDLFVAVTAGGSSADSSDEGMKWKSIAPIKQLRITSAKYRKVMI
jgi:hypothetical protein